MSDQAKAHAHALPDELSALLAQVRELLYSRPETATGEFVFPLVTAVLRATRKS